MGDASDLRYTWLLVTYRRKPLFGDAIRPEVERVLAGVCPDAGIVGATVMVDARWVSVEGRTDSEASPAVIARRLQRRSSVMLREHIGALESRSSVWTRRFLVTTRVLEPSAVEWFVGLQSTG